MKKILSAICVFSICYSSFSQGVLDSDFASGGEFVFLNNAEFATNVVDMVIQDDQKILLCGDNYVSEDLSAGFLMRLNSNGTPDNEFGDAGVARYASDAFSSAGFIGARLLDNDEIITMGALQIKGNQTNIYFTRFASDGQLIGELNGGAPSVVISANAYSHRFERSPQGKLILIYNLNPYQMSFPIAGDVYIHRFNSDGSPDLDFGVNGVLVFGEESFDERAYDMVFNQDEELFISGYRRDAASFSATAKAMVVAIDAGGDLISSFGSGGVALVAEESANLSANAIDLLPDESMVFAGFRFSPVDFIQYGILGKLDANGTGDSDFGPGSNGIVAVPEFSNGEFFDVIALPGQVVATGRANGSDYDVILVSRDLQGQPTAGFGTDGNAALWDLDGGDDEPVRLLRDGSDLIICGRSVIGGGGNEELSDPHQVIRGGTQISNEVSFVLRYSNSFQTSITENLSSEMSVYPNPANNKVMLWCMTQFPVDLLDVSGKLITSVLPKPFVVFELDISNLASGVYFIRQGDNSTRLVVE